MERVVISLEFAFKRQKSLDDKSLELSSLFELDDGWELKAPDRSTGAATRRQDILASWVDLRVGELGNVQVSWVHGVARVAVMASADDRLENIGEELEALFVASNKAAGLDHGVA